MGKRVHVVSKREEYGRTDAFNWCFTSFADLLGALGDGLYEEENGEGLSRFEMPKDEYKKVLKKLKDFDSLDEDEKEDAQCYLDELGENSLEYTIEVMESFLRDCDKESDYIIFSVW